MPNSYKGAGSPPSVCFGGPFPPDLGSGQSGGSTTTHVDNAMVAASDPFQPCCSGPCCSPPPCCGSGGDGGGPGGIGGDGGGFPVWGLPR
jgi:hypothetical protein